jgi:hypothetical protein
MPEIGKIATGMSTELRVGLETSEAIVAINGDATGDADGDEVVARAVCVPLLVAEHDVTTATQHNATVAKQTLGAVSRLT